MRAGFLDGMDGDDVGMIQRGDDLGLPLEALEPAAVGSDVAREELQSDLAFEGVSSARYTSPIPPCPNAFVTR
jgi:hypothetical protein